MQIGELKKAKNIVGTVYIGSVDTEYKTLVEIFGDPHYINEEGYKTRAEWIFKVDVDGKEVVIDIYDYKDFDIPVEQVTDWHVAGWDSSALLVVKEILANF